MGSLFTSHTYISESVILASFMRRTQTPPPVGALCFWSGAEKDTFPLLDCVYFVCFNRTLGWLSCAKDYQGFSMSANICIGFIFW